MALISLPPFLQETYGLRPTGTSDRIGRTGLGGSDVIAGTALTACGWFRRVNGLGGYENLLSFNRSGYFECFLSSGVFSMYNDTSFEVSSGFTVPADGRWFFAAMTGDATNQKIYLSYVPGVWAATASSTVDTGSNADVWFATETDGQWFDGDAACMRIWRRALTGPELFREMMSMDAVSQTQLIFDLRGADRINRVGGVQATASGTLRSGSRVLQLPSALPQFLPNIFTAASSAIAGTAAMQFGGTNTITAIGSLAGVCALTFSATDTIQATGALAGASTLVFGLTDTIGAKGALAGAAALTITPTTTISSIGALAGTAAISFSSTPTIGAVGALSGTAAAVFASTPTIVAAGSLAGTADLSLGSALEVPSTIRPIVGVAAMVFQQTVQPTLSAASQPGLAAMAFSASASLDGLGERGVLSRVDLTRATLGYPWLSQLSPVVAMVGGYHATSDMSLGASGVLTAKGALAGSAAETFTAAAVVGGIGALAGTCALTFGATVTSPGAIAGVAAMSFGAVAAPAGVIAGTCALIFGHGSSILNGIGRVLGQSLIQFSPLADLRVTGLVGVASMRFTATLGEHPQGLAAPLRKGYNVYGTSAFYFMHSMSKIATALISVPVPIVFTATGTMQAIANISGVAAMSFGGQGVVKGATSGAAAMEFIPLGLIRGIGALAGVGSLSFGGTAALGTATIPRGVATMRFTATGKLTTTGWGHRPPVAPGWIPKDRVGDGWTPKVAAPGEWVKKTGT